MTMMKLRYLSMVIALSSGLVHAAVPVYEGSQSGSYNSNQGYRDANGASAQGGAQAPLSAQGQLFMQLQQMQQEISTLRGLVEEQAYEIKQLKQQGLERYQELDQRFNSMETAAPVREAAADSASSEPADPAKEKLFYDAAYDLVKQRDFAKAQQAFSAFLRKYPRSQYAANAQYWLGEVNLSQGNLEQAASSFEKVTLDWPEHSKTPDSLYKLGDVQRQMGNREEAKLLWQRVVSKYADSSAGKLAERELRNY